MNSKQRQNRGTKMSLAQLATFDLPAKSQTQKITPTEDNLICPVEKAPVVSLKEIMVEQQGVNTSLHGKPTSLSKTCEKKPDFKKGRRMDIGGCASFYNVTADELDLRSLRERKVREDEEYERVRKAELEANTKRLDDLSKDNDFKSGEIKEYSTDFYRDFVDIRQKMAIQELAEGPLNEAGLYAYKIPQMMRNFMVSKLLDTGVEIVSRISKGLHLRSDNKKSFEWEMAMTSRNACFNMSKNGKVVTCDLRPTFQFSIMEVQIFKFTPDGGFDGPVYVLDMELAADHILKMLK